MVKISVKPRLQFSLGRIGRRLINSEGMRAVKSAKAEAVEQLGPIRPKAGKQRCHDGRRIRPRPRMRFSWSRISLTLTCSEGMRAVGSA